MTELDTTELGILVNRDYDALRHAFLDSFEKEKLRALVEPLAPKRYYYPTLFPKTTGWGAKGDIKRRVKFLSYVEPMLDELFLDGEELRFITKGVYNSFAEQYFLGYVAMYINQTLFLFTNYRIIMLNTDTKGRPQHMKWHIPYDQIKKFSTGWIFSSMNFKLTDKTKLAFSGVTKNDRGPLKQLVTHMIERCGEEEFHIPTHQSKDNLCPTCLEPVPSKTYTCPQCEEEYIRPMKPAIMSLFLPCLGDFYLGHYFLGSVEILGYAILWIIFGGLLAEQGLAALPAVVLGLGISHVVDAVLTRHMAMKGLISVRHTWGRKG